MAGYVPSVEEQTITFTRANPKASKLLPVRDAAAIAVEGFGPVQRGGAWTFNRGLRITTPATGPEADLLAVATGALIFHPAAGPDPARLKLQLTGLDEPAMRASGMPSWVPSLPSLMFHGVDPAAVQAAIAQLFADPARLAVANRIYQRITGAANPATAAALAQVFIQHPEQLADGIAVNVGEVLGAGVVVGTERVYELRAAATVAATDAANPAWYFAFWDLTGLIDLGTHSLGYRFGRTDEGLVANGTMRFVAKTGVDANAPFTDPALPALTVRAAIAAAADGDTVVILDGGTYAEAEIVIDKPINLTSTATLDPGQRHLGGTVNDAAAPVVPAALPILQGNGAFAGINENMTGDTAFIPTANTHRVLRYAVPANRGIAALTKVVVRYGGAREGGGILIIESGPVVVASCHVHRNIAYFNALFFNPTNGFPHPYHGSGWSQEGFGGGICAYTSSPIVWGNRIDRNLALNGGGIGLFARCFPLIGANYIAKNVLPDWFGTVTPGDGGGIRALTLNLRSQSLTLSNLDPTVAAEARQLATLFYDMFGLTVEVGEMYEAAHVTECQRNWIHLHHNRVLSNRAGDDGGGVYATGISRMRSTGNYVTGNTAARGDGGGFRISTASVLRSQNDMIANNRVDGAASEGATGGGIACRCSDLYLLGTRVEGNRSHFAGAGISFTANREGGVTGTSWLPSPLPTWDEQRAGAFHYDHAYLQIDATSRVLTNVADDAAKGKGGGLYLFRQNDPGTFVGDRVSAEIEDPSTVLDPSNDAAFKQGTSKPYRRLYLLDQTKNDPVSGNPPLIIADADLDVAPPMLTHISL